jgi:hypothetical protein
MSGICRLGVLVIILTLTHERRTLKTVGSLRRSIACVKWRHMSWWHDPRNGGCGRVVIFEHLSSSYVSVTMITVYVQPGRHGWRRGEMDPARVLRPTRAPRCRPRFQTTFARTHYVCFLAKKHTQWELVDPAYHQYEPVRDTTRGAPKRIKACPQTRENSGTAG